MRSLAGTVSAIALAFYLVGPASARSPKSIQKPRELQVAAAADLKFAMDAILKEFRQLHAGISVSVSYGSSGNFYSQLASRAPFDLFFSADSSYPRKLTEMGLAVEGSAFFYARGLLVLWAPRSSSIDLNKLGIQALRSESIRHIAIANPKHAPYGKAAEAALRASGLYEALEAKLVYGENVAQALQFVQSGAAEAGFIANSLAQAPGVKEAGQFWEVPQEIYPHLEQVGVIMNWTRDLAAARELRSFVLGNQGRNILLRFGFHLPGE